MRCVRRCYSVVQTRYLASQSSNVRANKVYAFDEDNSDCIGRGESPSVLAIELIKDERVTCPSAVQLSFFFVRTARVWPRYIPLVYHCFVNSTQASTLRID
jgi:hypothetical protein